MVRSGRQPNWRVNKDASSMYEALQLRLRDRVTIPPRFLNTLEKRGIKCDMPLLAELDEPGMVRMSPVESHYAKTAQAHKSGEGAVQDGLLLLEIDGYDRRLKIPDIVLAHLEVNFEQTVWLHVYAFPNWFEIWSAHYRRQNRNRLEETSFSEDSARE